MIGGTAMRHTLVCILLFSALFWNFPALAKVDLVTLPQRDAVRLTIYNSADLTLVSDTRALTLRKGLNRLQFSWANTLIDPTSLDMRPKRQADQVEILEISFPAQGKNLGIWNVESRVAGILPVEITYLTSGLSWRAFYVATLGRDEKSMDLKGYIRVINNSGEGYEDSEIRLIVGKISLLDEIATLARRKFPYGTPMTFKTDRELGREPPRPARLAKMKLEKAVSVLSERPKEIKKEALSEYFLYSIEGRETIPDRWAKRLLSFEATGVPVRNLYKYDTARFGDKVTRFLSFKNDAEHSLGKTPIPGGTLKAYKKLGEEGYLTYEGGSKFKYIPVGEDIELNLGSTSDLIVEPRLLNHESSDYTFDKQGDISGWREIRKINIEVKNTRPVPCQIEITRNFSSRSWQIEKSGDFDSFEKLDLKRVRFKLDMKPGEKRTFSYVLTTFHGLQADKRLMQSSG